MTGLAERIVREVLSDRYAWTVLEALAAEEEEIQYSELRKRLDMHPQNFKQALERLDRYAMLGRSLRGEPNNLGRRPVFLEATAVGRFWSEHWRSHLGSLEVEAAGIASRTRTPPGAGFYAFYKKHCGPMLEALGRVA